MTPASPPTAEDPHGVAPRDASMQVRTRWLLAFAISAPLIVLNCIWIANSEMKTGVTEVTISSLFLGVTFILFVITMLNLGLRRLVPRAGLHQGEMLAIYVMLSISSVVSGVGNYGFFLPFLANVTWFADPAKNQWAARFLPLLPAWWGPRDKDLILKPFYEGHSSPWHLLYLRAWSVPLVIWGVFFLVLIWTMLCVAAILRRQWSDHEHLTFPVIYLPVEMTADSGALYRNRLLWFGFAIPFIFQSLNSVHSIFPTVPSLEINRLKNLGDIFNNRPWSGIDAMPYAIHPAGVGLGFLVSLDMLFSTWFFYLVFKGLDVFGVAMGWRDPGQGWGGLSEPRFPYWGYQSWGAWITLALMSLALARPYLAAFFRKAWSRNYDDYDEREALSPRVALVGFFLGFLFLWVFGIWMGMTAWLCFCFLAIYLLIMVALSRIRAEAALPSTELIWVNPHQMLTTLIGTSNLSHSDLEGMAIYGWFNSDYRATAMPHEFEAFKAAGMGRIRMKPLVACILAAAVIAIIAASFSDLHLYYVNGAGTAKVNTWRIDKGNEPWNNLNHWWDNPRPTDPAAVLAAILGAAITLALTALRTRWMGFPLHPAAYVLNTSFAMEFFWLDFIVAWTCKTFVLRYGGMKAYRNALPFFLGLVLGDFVTGSAWSIVGVILKLDLYRTFAT